VLGKKARGLNREELIKASGLTGGGGLSRLLQELEESGFIRKYPSFGTTEKKHLYQLIDCYSLFYLKMIRGTTTMDANNWIAGLDSPDQRAWSGYAFEQVCLLHLDEIKKSLGISGVQTNTASWKSRGTGKGAQIDLLIDRRDHVINICEIKFSLNTFTIDKKYAEALRNKLQVFREESRSRKSLFLTMITTFGLTTNQYAGSIVQNDLTMDALFEPK